MQATMLHLSTILALVMKASFSKEECPCYCDSNDRMNCANQRLDTIPKNIPNYVTVINFQINQAQNIKENTFYGLKELVLLRLDSNKIHTIESKAFFGMPKLDELVLNNNEIQHFDERMVDPESPLKRGIKLDTNQLTKFPLNLLKRHPGISISVINNRIQCDCFTVIPPDLKEFVFGECHTSSGKQTINSMTFRSANCQKCEHQKCVHGSCYMDSDGNALCKCFEGFSGELCEIDGPKLFMDEISPSSSIDISKSTTMLLSSGVTKGKITTLIQTSTKNHSNNIKPTRKEKDQPSTSIPLVLSTTSSVLTSQIFDISKSTTMLLSSGVTKGKIRTVIQTSTKNHSNNIKPTRKEKYQLSTSIPLVLSTTSSGFSSEKFDPYELVKDIQLQTPNIKTGDKIIINGCQFRRNGPPITRGDYSPVYIKDGWNVTNTILIVNGSNRFQMKSLEFESALPIHVGSYRCGMRYKNGSLVDINSRPIHVSLKDVSETLLRAKASATPNQLEANNIKSKFEKLLEGMALEKPASVENPRITTRNGQNVWKSKILLSGLSSTEEKVKMCGAMHAMSEYLEKGEGLTPMDCCIDEENNTPVAIGHTIKHQCSSNSKRQTSELVCGFKPKDGPFWLTQSAACPRNPTKDALKGLKRARTCEEDEQRTPDKRCIPVDEKAKKLKELVSKGRPIEDEEGVDLSADIVQEIAKRVAQEKEKGEKTQLKRKKKITSDTLFAVNEIMKVNEKVLAKAQISKSSSTKIVKSLEMISISIGESLNETYPTYTFTDDNLAMTVSLVNQTQSKTSVVTYKKHQERVTNVGIYDDDLERDFKNDESMNGMLVLPGDAVTKVTNNQSMVIRCVTYKSGIFFLNQHQLDNITSGDRVIEHAVGSNVLSVSVGEEERSTHLEEPVTISFRNDSQSDGTGVIMFWDFDKDNWSGEGCWPINETKPGIISWNCSHLTNFALLINVNQDFNNPFALQLLSYIGGGISIGSLLITLFVYLSIRKLRRRLAPRLLICLSLSLLLLLVAFLVLADKTKWELGCKVIAGSIQYLTLATFFWMFCEGINLYRNFVILFNKSTNEYAVFVKMSFFAWGTPLVIVLLTVFLSMDEIGSHEICLVNGNAFYFGTLLPVGLILFFNWVVLVLAIRGMKTDKILHDNKQQTPTWLEIWRALICSTILGLAWTFGIFAIGDLRDIFQWLFCVFNAFQGLFIFLLFVVKNKEIQKYVLKAFHHSSVTSTSNSVDNCTKNGIPSSPNCQSNTKEYKHLSTSSYGQTNV